jgi:5-dehydro-4-deoxyglucarate dehydratase
MDFDQAKAALSSGLLSFPLTDFGEDGAFDEEGFRARLEWLTPYGASALFAAGGTGEAFSLSVDEHYRVIRSAVETCGERVPIIGSACYGTALAIEMAQNSERAGAAAILLMPHYLTEAPQSGIVEHVIAVCRAVRIGVIVYNRNVCRLEPEGVARIADACPNFIGFKDGIGDNELLVAFLSMLRHRIANLDTQTKTQRN